MFSLGKEQEQSYISIIEALESAGALYPCQPEIEIRHIADAEPKGIASSVYMITTSEGEETWRPVAVLGFLGGGQGTMTLCLALLTPPPPPMHLSECPKVFGKMSQSCPMCPQNDFN